MAFEIIANLIDNGIRYNRRGGTVSITLSRRQGETLLTVRDDGPGIPPDKQEAIFERFVRLGGAQGPDGTGLGLAIVRSAA